MPPPAEDLRPGAHDRPPSAEYLRPGARDTSGRRLLAFFLLAFGWSWAFWAPEALVSQGVIDRWPALPDVAAFGPAVAGIVMLFLDRGPEGLRELLARIVGTGLSLRWTVLGLLLFPAMAATIVLALAATGAAPELPWAGNLALLPLAFVYIFLLGGPLQEEFGWRGYALDPLQVRLGATGGSVVLGVAWTLWHLPLFFIPSQTIYYNRPVWGLALSVILLSVLMTWLYNNTGGSLGVVLLVHTAFNWSHGMLPVLQSDTGALLFLGGQALLVGLVVLVWGHRTLVRV